MAMTDLQPINQNKIRFLEQTLASRRSPETQSQYIPKLNLNKTYKEGVPNTTPRVFGYTADEYELADKIAQSGINFQDVNARIAKYQPKTPNPRGKAWEGYTTPEYNGTGELIANHPELKFNNLFA